MSELTVHPTRHRSTVSKFIYWGSSICLTFAFVMGTMLMNIPTADAQLPVEGSEIGAPGDFTGTNNCAPYDTCCLNPEDPLCKCPPNDCRQEDGSCGRCKTKCHNITILNVNTFGLDQHGLPRLPGTDLAIPMLFGPSMFVRMGERPSCFYRRFALSAAITAVLVAAGKVDVDTIDQAFAVIMGLMFKFDFEGMRRDLGETQRNLFENLSDADSIVDVFGALLFGAFNTAVDIVDNTSLTFGPALCGVVGVCSTVYDQQCNAVPLRDYGERCQGLPRTQATFFWADSPISLIMEEGFEPEDDMSVVNFKLNPTKGHQYWLWKASEKAPLLVYDPEHTGKITSATQLFGGWTFGGQRMASLIEDAPARPWNNGFDALATLDLDGDGKVSGRELAPLGLWFDRNQDGVSQDGEVVDLDSKGITALFYSGYNRDSVTENVVLERGFERKENNTIIHGKAIDWFTKGADHPFSLIADISLHGLPVGDAETDESTQNSQKVVMKSEVDKQAAPREAKANEGISELARGLSGVWSWRIDVKGLEAKREYDGHFIIVANNDEDIDIQSIIESYVMGEKDVEFSMLSRFFMKGKINGETLEFTGYTPDIMEKKESTAKLSGNELKGRTVVHTSLNGKPRKLFYDWTATKMAIK